MKGWGICRSYLTCAFYISVVTVVIEASNGISDEGAFYFTSMKNLDELDLENNYIGNLGAYQIAKLYKLKGL